MSLFALGKLFLEYELNVCVFAILVNFNLVRNLPSSSDLSPVVVQLPLFSGCAVAGVLPVGPCFGCAFISEKLPFFAGTVRAAHTSPHTHMCICVANMYMNTCLYMSVCVCLLSYLCE